MYTVLDTVLFTILYTVLYHTPDITQVSDGSVLFSVEHSTSCQPYIVLNTLFYNVLYTLLYSILYTVQSTVNCTVYYTGIL